MISSPAIKPKATVTIEPLGPRSAAAREHSIKVAVELGGVGQYADKGHAARIARISLSGFPPAAGAPDRRTFVEVSGEHKPVKKGGNVTSFVTGIQGSVICGGRPAEDSVDDVSAALVRAGYRVAVRERRECSEPACHEAALIDWNRPTEVPPGWYSPGVCGRHNYRTCTHCQSVYVLTSTSFVGQAPSVYCQVCNRIIIEWGSSKLWKAELVKRGANRSG